MKIVVFNGSPRMKDGYRVIKRIQEKINKKEKVELEHINLKELDIKECIGCMQCFERGEQSCPFKDDVPEIKEKLVEADGIIFISPVYACQITGTMKRVIDRMSFMFHRPELVGKPAINIVTTGGGGQNPTQKYLKLTACGWGCNLVSSLSVASPLYFENSEYYNPKYSDKINKKIEKLTNAFIKSMISPQNHVPTFYDIFMFHGLKSKTFMSKPDYDFWHERGWLKSSYYYEAKLNPLKKLFGMTLDYMIAIAAKKYSRA